MGFSHEPLSHYMKNDDCHFSRMVVGVSFTAFKKKFQITVTFYQKLLQAVAYYIAVLPPLTQSDGFMQVMLVCICSNISQRSVSLKGWM